MKNKDFLKKVNKFIGESETDYNPDDRYYRENRGMKPNKAALMKAIKDFENEIEGNIEFNVHAIKEFLKAAKNFDPNDRKLYKSDYDVYNRDSEPNLSAYEATCENVNSAVEFINSVISDAERARDKFIKDVLKAGFGDGYLQYYGDKYKEEHGDE